MPKHLNASQDLNVMDLMFTDLSHKELKKNLTLEVF